MNSNDSELGREENADSEASSYGMRNEGSESLAASDPAERASRAAADVGPSATGETTVADGDELAVVTHLDTAMYLLSNHRRRDALTYLRDRDEPVRVSELVEYVVALARERSVDPPPDLDELIAVDVVHSHLPKLVRSPVVEHGDDENTLRYVGDPVFDELLEITARIEFAPVDDDVR